MFLNKIISWAQGQEPCASRHFPHDWSNLAVVIDEFQQCLTQIKFPSDENDIFRHSENFTAAFQEW